jgi:hypothetical protein
MRILSAPDCAPHSNPVVLIFQVHLTTTREILSKQSPTINMCSDWLKSAKTRPWRQGLMLALDTLPGVWLIMHR